MCPRTRRRTAPSRCPASPPRSPGTYADVSMFKNFLVMYNFSFDWYCSYTDKTKVVVLNSSPILHTASIFFVSCSWGRRCRDGPGVRVAATAPPACVATTDPLAGVAATAPLAGIAFMTPLSGIVPMPRWPVLPPRLTCQSFLCQLATLPLQVPAVPCWSPLFSRFRAV